jgi:hypothetical protein
MVTPLAQGKRERATALPPSNFTYIFCMLAAIPIAMTALIAAISIVPVVARIIIAVTIVVVSVVEPVRIATRE